MSFHFRNQQASGRPQTIITRLIDPSQEYSLDVLNGYIHSQDSHYTNKRFLNSFWDFLFPLFEFSCKTEWHEIYTKSA